MTGSALPYEALGVPLGNVRRNEFGVVAHGKVVALRDGDLRCLRKSALPSGLEAQRVVTRAEDGEHGSVREVPHGVIDARVVVTPG